MSKERFEDADVAALFAGYPPKLREKLFLLRQLLFDTAKGIKEVGELEETIKWGQPSYLTTQSKSGSLVRIDVLKSQPGKYAMYFHCQTKLIPTFRYLYPDTFTYIGNRAIVFDEHDKIPLVELKHCISLALTYFLDNSVRAQRVFKSLIKGKAVTKKKGLTSKGFHQ